jgi:predicted RNA-binding protein YlxR (DUF448 family)
MLRTVAEEGRVVTDPTAVLPGRGAYVCGPECAEQARKRRAYGRALRQAVVTDEDFVESVGLHGEKARP